MSGAWPFYVRERGTCRFRRAPVRGVTAAPRRPATTSTHSSTEAAWSSHQRFCGSPPEFGDSLGEFPPPLPQQVGGTGGSGKTTTVHALSARPTAKSSGLCCGTARRLPSWSPGWRPTRETSLARARVERQSRGSLRCGAPAHPTRTDADTPSASAIRGTTTPRCSPSWTRYSGPLNLWGLAKSSEWRPTATWTQWAWRGLFWLPPVRNRCSSPRRRGLGTCSPSTP